MNKSVKLVTLTALALVFSIQSANAQSMLEKNTVFAANTEGIRTYRIPGMVVTTKGTVLAYCEARKNNSSDWGEIEVHLRRSTDGGKTWELQKKIAQNRRSLTCVSLLVH